MHFYYFVIISPLRRDWTFISKNLIRCFLPGLVENIPVVLEKKDFKKFSIMYYYYFAIISTLRRAWPYIWKKKQLESSSLKDALCQVWLKMPQWFWRRRLLKVFNVFFLLPNYLPFEKGVALPLNKRESPSPKDALCQVWLKLAQWFWIRRQTDKQTDRRRTTGDQNFGSGELKMFKIETLRNIVPYIYIYTPISMCSDFIWIYGKLNVPDMKYSW